MSNAASKLESPHDRRLPEFLRSTYMADNAARMPLRTIRAAYGYAHTTSGTATWLTDNVVADELIKLGFERVDDASFALRENDDVLRQRAERDAREKAEKNARFRAMAPAPARAPQLAKAGVPAGAGAKSAPVSANDDEIDQVFDALLSEKKKTTPRGRVLDIPASFDWNAPVEPIEYLVDGLIPVGTVGMFVAPGSSVKTWTALDIAKALATGAPWLGSFVTQKGRTLILDFESGLYELRRRIHLLGRDGVAPESIIPLAYPSERIDDIEFWKALTRKLRADRFDLIIVDSLSEGAAGVDENAPEASFPLKCASRLTEFVSASVLFIHHARKDDGDDKKMVRGHSSIYASCDWAYRFKDVEETPEYRRMTMASTKPCMGIRPKEIEIELSDAGLRAVTKERSTEGRQRAEDAKEARVRECLATKPQPNVRAIERWLKMQNGSLTDTIAAMKVQRKIVSIPGVGLCLDDPADRLERIKKVVTTYKLFTAAQVAEQAHVDTDFVRTAMRLSVIYQQYGDDGLNGPIALTAEATSNWQMVVIKFISA